MASKSVRESVEKSKPTKPEKPRPDFPLTPHDRGRWCKKVKGKIYYFGTWDNPDGALNEWLEQKDYILGGRDPRDIGAEWTAETLCESFLASKSQQVELGDLSGRTFECYQSACQRFVDYIGKNRRLETIDAPDFARYRSSFPDTWGPVRINSEICRLGVVLKYAYEVGAVDRPIRTGPNFKRVSAKRLRLDKASRPKKEFSAAEIRTLISLADRQMKAMILLAINCGFGNADCARLTISTIDLKAAWYEQLRHKTGVPRAAALWPETVAALKEAIANRFEGAPDELSDRVFITKYRRAWYREKVGTDAIAPAFAKLTEKAGCNRQGVGFYALRHVFATVAGNTKDQIAVNYVMGHSDASMAAVYREGIDPKRIKAVCQHVRKWLFPSAKRSRK
jgi:integrase